MQNMYNNQFGGQPIFPWGQPWTQQQYQPTIQAPQNTQPQPQPPNSLRGEMVDGRAVVDAKNASIDCVMSYYPTVDGSSIYAKRINPQTGLPETFEYRVVQQEAETATTPVDYSQAFSEIGGKVDKLTAMMEEFIK